MQFVCCSYADYYKWPIFLHCSALSGNEWWVNSGALKINRNHPFQLDVIVYQWVMWSELHEVKNKQKNPPKTQRSVYIFFWGFVHMHHSSKCTLCISILLIPKIKRGYQSPFQTLSQQSTLFFSLFFFFLIWGAYIFIQSRVFLYISPLNTFLFLNINPTLVLKWSLKRFLNAITVIHSQLITQSRSRCSWRPVNNYKSLQTRDLPVAAHAHTHKTQLAQLF